MLTFQQRRDTILSQFAQAKADLETLNSDIDAFSSLQVESSTLHTLHDGRYYKESFCSCKMPLL